MARLGRCIVEVMIEEYGREEVILRLSDPFWFQSLGCVLGMDWHSSGITTSVVGALKRSLNPISRELGIHVCGGRGKHSRKTPGELQQIGERLGLDSRALIRSSRLTAKVDNTAIQDGYQLYLHAFFLTCDGKWTVIQQGMNHQNAMARRYHWHSDHFRSFVEDPHTAVCGTNHGKILNLTDGAATETKQGILSLAAEEPAQIIREASKLLMPKHHDVRVKDVNIRRLGSVLELSHRKEIKGFDDLLLTPGLGPRTLQSLTLVSEVIHGTPSRFRDPARFAFAHGGKDGHPFPVPLKVYDKTIEELNIVINRTKVGHNEKKDAFKRLHHLANRIENNLVPDPSKFDKVINTEWNRKHEYGGRTVMDDRQPTIPGQLSLF